MPAPRLLADRRVRFVVLALAGSGSADGFMPVVLSFAVLQATGSAGQLGLVLAGQGAVALLFTLAGDRFPRGRILTGSLLARAAAAAGLATALVTDVASFGLLLAMAAAYGCADGFFGPVSTASLPDIVHPAQLAPANALTGGTTPPRHSPGSSWPPSAQVPGSSARQPCSPPPPAAWQPPGSPNAGPSRQPG
jgi:MFS family permease